MVRVLVIDDSREVRRRIVERLREAGLDVIGEADSVAAAGALTIALVPDAIVLDVLLPDGNGLELLPSLRRGVPGATIVVVTNEPRPSYRREALSRGADHFFDKATQFDLIAAALVSARAR